MHAKLLQLCPTLCDHMACSPPGSPVRGISQARILEGVENFFSKGSSLQVRSLGWEDPLEKEKSTHSSIPAWRIPRPV